MPNQEATALSINDKIMIVGGYGKVGKSIAMFLAPAFPSRIIVAGRDAAKANSAAQEIGSETTGRAIDIFNNNNSSALDGVALVVVCLDQKDTSFVKKCLSSGIHYVDISADYNFLLQVEKLDYLARENDATAILSVGVAPGLTNLLAAHVHKKMKNPERIDIVLELGLGDHHGKTALEWMFDNLDAEYELIEDGQPKKVKSFGQSINVLIPGIKSKQPAYSFNFSDQHVITRTLGLSAAATWIRFENRAATWLVAKFAQAGMAKMLRGKGGRKIALWLLMNFHIGSDICAVAAIAAGRDGKNSGNKTTAIGVVGYKEAQMTAIVASETVRQLLSKTQNFGVFHIEQLIELDPVISALKKEIPTLVVNL